MACELEINSTPITLFCPLDTDLIWLQRGNNIERIDWLTLKGCLAVEQRVFDITGALVTVLPSVTNLKVYINGLLQEEGLDYTVAGTTVTMIYPLIAGEKVNYIFN